ncbi:hypothetical protein C8J56DRAFT_910153, partial [Mycena floridula]
LQPYPDLPEDSCRLCFSRDISTPPTMQPYPDLPEDICRLILETAVEQDRLAALHLVLVSRRVQRWIEPLLYRVIELRPTKRVARFQWTITASSKPASFFAIHVQKLFISNVYDTRAIAIILSVCTGVKSLAAWSLELPVAGITLRSSIRRLSLDVDALRRIRFGNPEYLTHLQFTSPISPALIQSTLAEFTNLTHLALVPGPEDDKSITDCVAEIALYIPSTVHIVLLNIIECDNTIADVTLSWMTQKCDPYMIMRLYPLHDKDWGHISWSESDIWELGAEIQAKRRGHGKSCGRSGPLAEVRRVCEYRDGVD